MLAYNGAGFHGFQRQPGQRTVEGELIGCLQAMGLTGGLAFASRTDTGVHATGQVVCFNVDAGAALEAVSEQLGGLLPADMDLRALVWAPPRFHPRWSATGKRYVYLLTGDIPERAPLDVALEELRQAAVLTGFTAAGAPLRTMPPLSGLRIDDHEAGWRVTFEGPAFARYAIRHMMGCAVAQARGELPAGSCAATALMAGPYRGPRAPAHGLSLEQVYYPAGLDPFPG